MYSASATIIKYKKKEKLAQVKLQYQTGPQGDTKDH